MRPFSVGLVALIFGGCAGMIQNQARETAARDHACALDDTHIDRDASIGTSYAYWISVCGRTRYYRFQSEPVTGGRFVDDTTRFATAGATR